MVTLFLQQWSPCYTKNKSGRPDVPSILLPLYVFQIVHKSAQKPGLWSGYPQHFLLSLLFGNVFHVLEKKWWISCFNISMGIFQKWPKNESFSNDELHFPICRWVYFKNDIKLKVFPMMNCIFQYIDGSISKMT